MAARKKNARRLAAWLAFVDETGFLTAPLVNRSWAPKGRTPILRQRGNSRQKASAIGAIALSPARRRVKLLFSLRSHKNVNAVWAESFLRSLARELRGRVVVVWDNLNVHRAQPVRRLAERRRRVRLVYLPPYAPELNAVEYLWAHLKTGSLANWAPRDVDELAVAARRSVKRVGRHQGLLRGFLRHTGLFSH